MAGKEYTPRFKLWAESIGKKPEDAIERDEHGTPMNLFEFSLWIQARWRDWHAEHPGRLGVSDEDHASFDAWLENLVRSTAPERLSGQEG
jgi:hypothetical protein